MMLFSALFNGDNKGLSNDTSMLCVRALSRLGIQTNIDEMQLAGDLVESTLSLARRKALSDKAKIDVGNLYNCLTPSYIESFLYNHITDLNVFNRDDRGVFTERLINIKETINYMLGSATGICGGTPDGVVCNNALLKLFETFGTNRMLRLGDVQYGGTWKSVNTKYLDEVVKSGWLTSWEYLNHGFAMHCVTNDKGETSRRLVTKSASILRKMNEFGLLYTKDSSGVDITTLISKVNPAADKKNFLDGKTAVVRLEYQPSIHKYSYTVSARAEMKDMYMLPLIEAEATFLTIMSGVTNTQASTGFAEIKRYDADKNTIVTKVTSSINTMQNCYSGITGDDSVAMLRNKIDSSIIGLDVNSMVVRLFNLEKSIYGRITSSIAPGTIISIGPGNPKTVDTSCHDIDYNLLSLVFHSKVSRMTKADFEAVSGVIPITAPTVRAKKQAILQWQSNLKPDDLYRILNYPDKGIAQVFGNNLKEAMMKRKNYLPRYLKNFTPLTVEAVMKEAETSGRTPEEVLDNVMKNGVLHATVYSSSGSVRETYITKNEDILTNVYGDNYVSLFGSRRARLYAVLKGLDTVASFTDMVDLLKEYGLEDFTSWKVYELYAKSFEHIEELYRTKGLKSIIEAEIAKLAESDYGSIKMVTGMKVNAYSLVRANGEVSLYDCFNMSNIISIEYTTR